MKLCQSSTVTAVRTMQHDETSTTKMGEQQLFYTELCRVITNVCDGKALDSTDCSAVSEQETA